MYKRLLLFEGVFTLLALSTGYVVMTDGYLAFFPLVQTLMDQAWGVQLLAEFTVALGLLLYWMRGDAREREIAWWPFAAATLVFGALGPVAYLSWREWVVVRESLQARTREVRAEAA